MKKKILSFILCSSMLLGGSISVFADTVTTTGEHEVSVEGEILSTFEVILPASITLQSGQSHVDFDVTVTANTSIGDEEVLSIVPEEVIYLAKNENSEDLVQVLVYQDKKKFIGTELGSENVTTQCTVETGKLSSGTYDGVLKFNISLGEDHAIIVDGTPRSWNWLLYNDYFSISEDGVLSKGTADLSGLSGTLNISNRVKTIDTKAFEGSAISTVVLSQTVENINDAAFMSADSLTTISVADGNKSFTSIDGVLFSADGTKLLAYPAGNPATDYKIEPNVSEIGAYAFAYCTNIVSLSIPNTVTKTGKGAFTDMSVMSSLIDVSSNWYNNEDFYSPELLSSDVGSILMAKKVNNCLTAYYHYLNEAYPTYEYMGTGAIRQTAEAYYKDCYRVLVFDGSEESISGTNSCNRLYFVNDTVSKLVSLDGTSIDRSAYNSVPFYDSSFSASKTSGYYITKSSSGSGDACKVYSSISTFNCADVFYSEVDIYDVDNNLIYKADIVK